MQINDQVSRIDFLSAKFFLTEVMLVEDVELR